MLDPTGFLLSLVYMVLLIGILSYISKRLRVGFSTEMIGAFFVYYLLFFIVSTLLPFVPNLPDTSLFGEMITHNYFPPHQSLGVRLYHGITYPIRVLSLFRVEIFIVFQIFLFILSLMSLWASWQIVLRANGIDDSIGRELFLVLSAIYPSFLLYIPLPLREYFILFGFSIMIYGLIERYYLHRGLIPIFIGSFLLIFGRPQLIVIVIIFLAIFQKNRWIKYGFIGGAIVLLPIIFSKLTSYQFTPEFFGYLRNASNQRYGELAYGAVEWGSYMDMIADLPALFFQFVLSPFPILHDKNPLSLLAIFIDSIFSIAIYLSVIYAGVRVSKIYLFIFIISGVIFAIWEFHIGGAVRHRLPLVAMLLPIASYGITKLYYDIKRVKR
jgi:hypothetical protein